MPTVSVVLPTYNRAALLPKAMRSVLDQSYRDLELIVVDDASTDATEDVARGIGDARVRYLRQPERRGASAARNRGIAEARGELIAFQDSDDEWVAGKLQLQVDRLSALPADVALTQGAVRYLGPVTRYVFSGFRAGQERTAVLPVNNGTYVQAWLARAAVLREMRGFDERLAQWEDWELLIRICQRYRVDMDERVMALIHDTPGSLVTQSHRRVQSLATILDKHAALMAAHPPALAINWYAMARFELIDGRPAQARSLLLRSLRLEPLRARTWAMLAFSLLGTPLIRRIYAWRDATRRSAATSG
jgi:glycosyltransferase involved in cell wall biosynthesis